MSAPRSSAVGANDQPPVGGAQDGKPPGAGAQPHPHHNPAGATKPPAVGRPRRRPAPAVPGEVPGQPQGGIEQPRPEPLQPPSDRPVPPADARRQEPATPGKGKDGNRDRDREAGKSGGMFLRLAAFLFVFLIGFLAGLSYVPLMDYIQRTASVAERQDGETVAASEPADGAPVEDAAAADAAESRDVQPADVAVQGQDAPLTAAGGEPAGATETAADRQAAAPSDPKPAGEPAMEVVGTGPATFSGVDAFLTGAGQASVVTTGDGSAALRLSGIAVADLPDLHVALVAGEPVGNDIDFLNADRIALGPYKSGPGDRDYPIPEGIAVADYPTVVIWSRPFGMVVAQASLRN